MPVSVLHGAVSISLISSRDSTTQQEAGYTALGTLTLLTQALGCRGDGAGCVCCSGDPHPAQTGSGLQEEAVCAALATLTQLTWALGCGGRACVPPWGPSPCSRGRWAAGVSWGLGGWRGTQAPPPARHLAAAQGV